MNVRYCNCQPEDGQLKVAARETEKQKDKGR